MRFAGFLVGILMVTVMLANAGHLLAYSKVVNTWWMRDFFAVQEELAARSAKKRLFVVAGSNALFGFDGDLVDRTTDYKMVNLGLHASIDLEFHTARLSRILRAGDIVLLPLEHAFYRRNLITDYEQQQRLLWHQAEVGYPSILDALRYNAATPTETMLGYAWQKLVHGRAAVRPLDVSALMRHPGTPKERCSPSSCVYDISQIDASGFIYPAGPPIGLAMEYYQKELAYPAWDFHSVPAYSLAGFTHLKAVVEAAGGQVVFTWPAEVLSAGNRPDDRKSIDARLKFAKEFEGAGFRMICRPEDAILPVGMFYDTHYHLNGLGATARTLKLIGCLSQLGIVAAPPPSARLPATSSELVDLIRVRARRMPPMLDFELALLGMSDVAGRIPSNAQATDWQRLDLHSKHFERLSRQSSPRLEWRSIARGLELRADGIDDCKIAGLVASDAISLAGDHCYLRLTLAR